MHEWTQQDKIALGDADSYSQWQRAYQTLIEAGADEPIGADGLRYVGASVPRRDVLYKARGRAAYAANLSFPGMLHGCFLRSTHPYARIKRLDVAKARAAPGVHAVLTAQDIPADRLLVGSLVPDTPILARDVVRHVGEPVAAVAADTIAAAEAALDLIEVEYEPMTPVLTPAEALRPDAPRLHTSGNIIADLQDNHGDVDAALAAADVVVTGTYTTEPIEHCFLEAQAGISYFDEKGVLTLLVCTQYPHHHHRQLARVTGLPSEKIRVVQTAIGGAFGGKIDVTVECAASLMTIMTGRPVKMVLSREEVFASTTKRHAMTITHRLGATRDGRITAIDTRILCDGGAYSSYSLIVAGRCIIHAALPYDVPNVRARVTTTFTNHVPSGAMRSFGIVKVAFATESQIDKLARTLGMSPIEIRRMNCLKRGMRAGTGQVLHSIALDSTLRAIAPIYQERRQALAVPANGREGSLKRGLGIACLGYGIGYSGIKNPSTARIEALPDGTVLAHFGTPDIGTGSDHTMAQIVADSIGVSLARIRVVSGDSVHTEDSGPTSASRTTYFSGNAGKIAGDEFKRQFVAKLASALAISADAVRLENDHAIVENQPMPFEQACAAIGPALGDIRAFGLFDPDAELNLKTFRGTPYPTYTFATHLAEVGVDCDTGRVDVTGYWAAHDAGKIVNPIGAEGQVEGGIVMGLGMALWEKIVRKNGYIENPGYRDYLLPGSRDVPPFIKTIFVDEHDASGPYGAKGLAEPAIVPVPAAVAAAICDAIGVRPEKLPMDAESILTLLQSAAKGASCT
ncbi:MAG: xanthine dehydrogenase family protein [Hyphomicrobiales bacterium]|nr:xanthine dehydrogenase family protein [Hyphomicrobiales bacterium]